MNEKYIIGAVAGFALAYLLMPKAKQQTTQIPQRRPAPTQQPTQSRPLPAVRRMGKIGYGGGLPFIAVRPWSQQIPLHV